MNIDQSKVTAHYLNGLAVAVVATLGAAYLAGRVPIGLLVIGALTSNWYGWPKKPQGRPDMQSVDGYHEASAAADEGGRA